MRNAHILTLFAVLAWCPATASASPAAEAPAPRTGLAALVEKMPDADPNGKYTGPPPEQAAQVYAEVLKGGKDAIVALVGMMSEPAGPDYKVRYLLHGLAMHVSRPDAEKDRAMVCEALASTLGGDRPKTVQAFVVQELQYAGGKEAMQVLGRLLTDEQLCDPAARALLAIGDAGPVLRQALGAAKGRCRLHIIQALGVARDSASAADVRKAAADPDRDVRLAAIDALANMGDAASADLILKAADAAEPYDRTRGTEAALVLAKRLTEAGRKADAERIYRTLWDTRTAPEDRHVRTAAMVGLADLKGDMNDLLAAMKAGDPQIRAVALQMAAAMGGADATAKLVDATKKAMPADRASLLAILGARADQAALPAVLAMFKDPDEQVYTAAMHAAAQIGGPGTVEALLAEVAARSGRDRQTAADALARSRNPGAGEAVAAAIGKTTDPDVKAALIGVLGTRREEGQLAAVTAAADDANPRVRLAAIRALGQMGGPAQLASIVKSLKQAGDDAQRAAAEEALVAACGRGMADACTDLVVAAMTDAPPANAATMMRVLAAAGTRRALDAVIAQTRSTTAELRDAAIRAMADWRNKDAATALLEIARSADNLTHKVLALRGAIRLASAKGTGADEKLKILAEAMKVASRPEEKREALGALATVQTAEALKVAAAALTDESVKEEAAAAVVQIAEAVARRNPDAMREAVAKALEVARNERVRATAERLLKQVKKP